MAAEGTFESTQYLTFTLDEEDFAVEIVKVREVLDYTRITKVPRTPDFLRGVINLRGNVVPVVDLRLKLGMEVGEKTIDTCIIIVEIQIDIDKLQIGALADSVKGVIDLDPSRIVPPPKLGTKIDTEFIKGMGEQNDGHFLIILDIDKILSIEEIGSIQKQPKYDKSDEQEVEEPEKE